MSDVEAGNLQQTYTVDTLTKLSIPKNELFFILGADVAIKVSTWSRYQELNKLTNFLIAPRNHIKDDTLQNKFPFKYQLITGEELDISSTNIRNKFNEGADMTQSVPESLLEYIVKNKIY